MRATPNDRGLGPVSVVLLIGLFFVTPIWADADHDHADTRGFLVQLIKPMGILTLLLVAATVALGVLRRLWKPGLMLKIHKICGVWALVAGAVHAALVVFLH